MRYFFSFLLVIFLFASFGQPVLSESSYVLPYPSVMPGSKAYKLHLFWEKISKYWYFGSFGQFKYNLKFSDKYLVEAKTLFEYKQYLLAYNALQRSDQYFKNIPSLLIKAQEENKDITQTQKIFKEASLKHIEELTKLKEVVPKEFVWKPEKSNETKLNLWESIDNSLKIRKIN